MGSTAKENMTMSCVALKGVLECSEPSNFITKNWKGEWAKSLCCLRADEGWMVPPIICIFWRFCPAWQDGLFSSGRGGWERHPHPVPCLLPLGLLTVTSALVQALSVAHENCSHSIAKGSSEPCGKGQECFTRAGESAVHWKLLSLCNNFNTSRGSRDQYS